MVALSKRDRAFHHPCDVDVLSLKRSDACGETIYPAFPALSAVVELLVVALGGAIDKNTGNYIFILKIFV